MKSVFDSSVNDLVEQMTPEEKVGQLFLTGLKQACMDKDTEKRIRLLKIGSFLLFSKNTPDPETTERLIREMKQTALCNETPIPLLCAIDQENGRVSRITDGVSLFPANYALGQIGDESIVWKTAYITGIELKSMGIDWNLAPVVDVHSNPDNPVIGVRSFSDDPEVVCRMAKNAVRGFREAGILSCAKHFPGHGDVDIDSHLDLPVCNKSRKELHVTELPPFYAAIEAGAPAIMTAHILYPKLDPVYPATASRFILEDILKNKLGFQGVVISDALEMKALSERFNIAKLAVQIINAGCDMLIYSENMPAGISFESVYQTVLDATRSGDISKNRLNDAVRKILRMKKSVLSSPEQKTNTSRFLHDHTFLFRVLKLAFQTNEDAPHFPVNAGEKKVVVLTDHPGWQDRLKSASFVRGLHFLEPIAKKTPVIDENTDEIWLFIDNPDALPQRDKLHLPKPAKVRMFSLNDPGLKNKTGIRYDSYINLYGDKLPMEAILELVSGMKT